MTAMAPTVQLRDPATQTDRTENPSNWTTHPNLPPKWDKKRLGRLFDMIETSTRNTADFRAKWVDLIQYSVGRHYNGGSKGFARPKNDIHAFKQAYVFRLAGAVPDFSVSAKNLQLRPQAFNIECDLNRTVDNLNLEEFQERSIGEAFFGLAIAKVSTEWTGEYVEQYGQMFEKQRVRVRLVDTEDSIIDIAVKSSDEMKFIGNRYNKPVQEILDDENYDEQAKAYVRRMRGSGRGDNPVPWEHQPLAIAGVTQNQVDQDLEDQVQLMDVYLPKEKWLLTLIVGAPNVPPLYGAHWYACDPYIPLVFEYVEGNVLPMPPARHWIDICSSVDNAMAKLLNQLRRQKTIGVVRSGSEGDKARVDATPDGGACRVESQYGVSEARFGGPDAAAQAFVISLRQLASDIAGNINAMAGLDTSADTATEASMMASGSGATLDAYRRKVRLWWSRIGQAIAWFNHNNALHNPSPDIQRGDPRLGVVIYGNGPGREYEGWSFEERQQFEFFDFMFDVVPLSNAYQGPEEKAARVTRLLTEIFSQFAPIAMQQGVVPDIAEWIRIVAEQLNLEPEVRAIMVRTDIPEVPLSGGSNGAMMPAGNKPNGKYVHQSRPSSVTRRGSEMQMVSDLMAAAGRQGAQQQGAAA